MEITEIKKKGNSETYHIYVDNKYYALIAYDYIYKYKLKVGTNIAEEQLKSIKKESDNFVCFNMALGYVSKKTCTEKDVKEYLKKHQFETESIVLALNKLKDYGYVNDKVWAERTAQSLNSQHGNLYIKQKLANKGIKEEVITEILEDCSEKEACILQANKWIKSHGVPEDMNSKNKFFASLVRKGFGYDTVRNVLKEILNNLEVEDDWN